MRTNGWIVEIEEIAPEGTSFVQCYRVMYDEAMLVFGPKVGSGYIALMSTISQIRFYYVRGLFCST